MQSNRHRLFPAAAIIIFALLSSCRLPSQSLNPYPTVGAIPVPAGFHRVPAAPAAFSTWLRNIRLKKDRTVYLYNNRPKGNQEAQFAVLDVSVGKQDLQQCADAVMRLRAEYLYAAGDYDDINYYTEQGVRLNFQEWMHGQRTHLSGDRLVSYRGPTVVHPSGASQRTVFDEYLNTVFTYCGTRSLEKQLLPVPSFNTIQTGDVLIKGGAPGHAMLVIDMAEDAQGHRRTSSELRKASSLAFLAHSLRSAREPSLAPPRSVPSLSLGNARPELYAGPGYPYRHQPGQSGR